MDALAINSVMPHLFIQKEIRFTFPPFAKYIIGFVIPLIFPALLLQQFKIQRELKSRLINMFGESSSTDDGNYEQSLYPCPVFIQEGEGLIHGFMSSLYGTEEEVDFTSRSWKETEEPYYEAEQLAFHGHGNWNWNWPGCFTERWGENFFSLGYASQDCVSSLEKIEYFSQDQDEEEEEEPRDSYFSYQQDTENQPACNYNPWLAYGGGEEDSYDSYSGQEPQIKYGYNPDHMQLCEGIFGYWPCLFREQLQTPAEQ